MKANYIQGLLQRNIGFAETIPGADHSRLFLPPPTAGVARSAAMEYNPFEGDDSAAEPVSPIPVLATTDLSTTLPGRAPSNGSTHAVNEPNTRLNVGSPASQETQILHASTSPTVETHLYDTIQHRHEHHYHTHTGLPETEPTSLEPPTTAPATTGESSQRQGEKSDSPSKTSHGQAALPETGVANTDIKNDEMVVPGPYIKPLVKLPATLQERTSPEQKVKTDTKAFAPTPPGHTETLMPRVKPVEIKLRSQTPVSQVNIGRLVVEITPATEKNRTKAAVAKPAAVKTRRQGKAGRLPSSSRFGLGQL